MSQETIDRLTEEIEEAEAEFEEQRDLILKLELDEEQEGTDMSSPLKYARAELNEIELRIRELRLQLKEAEQAEEDGDVLITIGNRTLSVPIFSLESLSDIPKPRKYTTN